MSEEKVGLLLKMIDDEMPEAEWTSWPDGYPGEIEAALIDAVLSIQASYGSESNGVRAAVRRYKSQVGDDPADNLVRLSEFDPEALQALLNNQVTSGRTKASAIAEAAANLVKVGVINASQLDPHDKAQESAYTSVHGLGCVTWEYLGMLLGKPGVKADTWIMRATSRAVGEEVSASEARQLVMAAADHLGVGATELDHAIWAYERDRKDN